MNRNRFEEILSFLHFNNNQEVATDPANPNYDKLFKLKPLIDHFRTVFKGLVTAETMQCINEMMVPFKGRHGAKQYMPKKPCKWGYKFWCRAGMSGYVYDFEILGSQEAKGPPPGVNPEEFGESENVVLRLSKELEKNRHQLFFDNYFSSPKLLVNLMSRGILAVATLRSDRSCGCPLPAEKDMRKNGRGDLAEFTDSKAGLVICAWYDNRRVLTISNFLGKHPVSNCKRYDRKKKETVSVPRPASVELYNKFMGGVDKADMFLSLYRTKHRSRKWYHCIAFHLISLAAVNAFVMYREIGGSGSFLDFIVDVCRCLLAVEEPNDPDSQSTSVVRVQRSLKASQVPKDIRFDKCNHWPLQVEKPQRCKNTGCNRRMRFLCSKCQVYLCVTGTTCFLVYHDMTSE
ncbi:Hypothetical predicted protein [Paramuricea clavata]|uniref:Uncharacterized protein n=1 Tax=Paramuricea clavata TaxID=317549 RepID=A0A6S7KBP5_PARCT|nr:Hypothetical predicted protein [Paramuricea clavata]